MKKFSIGKLEKARKNPIEFAKELKSGISSDGGFGGYPKSMRWLNAICEYHKTDKISDAFNSLEHGFSGRKDTAKNRAELESFMQALENYESEVIKRKLALVKSREPINISINSQLRISGIIPIIFMKPIDGFSAYFVTTENTDWEIELKYPIVQNFVAKEVFNTENKGIDIGYINYFTGEFQETNFSSVEIRQATKELESIGQTIILNM